MIKNLIMIKTDMKEKKMNAKNSKTGLEELLQKQRAFLATGKTKDVKVRKEYLKKLKKSIKDHEEDIIEALYSDFRKPPFETFSSEIGTVLVELSESIKNVKKWAKVQRAATPMSHMPGKSRVYPEPYGVVLVISPWNYPFNLAMAPVIGALTAGNTVILKPASASPATSQVMDKILSSVFPEEYVKVLIGDEVKHTLLDYEYDYIFFTGGPEIGRDVMSKAAKFLTPVTLELGGKSPCIIADDADMTNTANRIVWGKFFNCGQTCVAPDYLIMTDKVKKQLFEEMKKAVKKRFGDNPKASPDFARVISDKHWARLEKLLHRGNIVIGGEVDPATRYIAPTVIDNIKPEDPVMQEEIFGPIFPVITVDSMDEAIKFINSRPKPLALYIFTKSRKTAKRFMTETISGGGCVNDTLMHFPNGNLPFGGVGLSGMGSYHGRKSFDTFTHYKGIYHNVNWIDVPFRYAPYTKFGLKIVKLFMR